MTTHPAATTPTRPTLSGAGPRPPLDALHPALARTRRRRLPIIVRGDGPLRLGRRTASATSTGWPGCSSCRSGTAAPSSPRRPRKQAARARVLPALVATRTRRRSSWPSGWPRYAPGDLNRVFFTTGGGEAVETAWKLARQYFKLIGKPTKHKVISRSIAYHGTTHGRAVDHRHARRSRRRSSRWCPARSRCPTPTSTGRPSTATTSRRSAAGPPTRSSEAIEFEGPDTVAAVFLEPVQNSGGCFPPPPGYFQRVREICDRHGVLLVSDEVICAFGRLGHHVRCDRYGYQPDIITCAKGMTSGYSPIGALIASDRLFEPFLHGDDVVPARLHLRRAPGVRRGRAGQPRHLRARGPARPRARADGRVPRHPREAARPADRRRRPRRRLLLRHRAGQGQGDPGDLRRRRSPSGCCAASCPGRCSTPGCTAGPTTAATRSSSSRRR